MKVLDPEYNALLVLLKFYKHYFAAEPQFQYDDDPSKSKISIGVSLIGTYEQEQKMISRPRILFAGAGMSIRDIKPSSGARVVNFVTDKQSGVAVININGRIDSINEAQLAELRGHMIKGIVLYKFVTQYPECAQSLGQMQLVLPLSFGPSTRQGDKYYTCNFNLQGVISINLTVDINFDSTLLSRIKILKDSVDWTYVE